MGAVGSYRSDDSFSGDEKKAFITFKGCMEAKIASAGKGTVDRLFNHLCLFNEVRKAAEGQLEYVESPAGKVVPVGQ